MNCNIFNNIGEYSRLNGLLFSTLIINFSNAFSKSIKTNTYNTIWNSYRSKICTIPESIETNLRNATTNCYKCKI